MKKKESQGHLAQSLHNAELYKCSICNSWLPNLHTDNTIKEKYTNSAKCNFCQFVQRKTFLLIFSQWSLKIIFSFFSNYYNANYIHGMSCLSSKYIYTGVYSVHGLILTIPYYWTQSTPCCTPISANFNQ